MTKVETCKNSGASDLSLTKPPTKYNNNLIPILQNLSNSHLNELWLTAVRLGEEDICRQIEKIRFERLERERERFYAEYLD